MTRWSRSGCFVLLLLLAACTPPLRGPDPVAEPLALREAIHASRRSAKAYSRFVTSLDVEAVFVSWDIRLARVDEQVRSQGLSPEGAEELLAREMLEGEQYVEFLLGVYSSFEEWSDLRGDEPTWSLSLVGDGSRASPLEIRSWEPQDAEQWLFFQEMSPWARLYRIRFERIDPASGGDLLAPEAGHFSLEFRSLFGVAKCRWEFVRDL